MSSSSSGFAAASAGTVGIETDAGLIPGELTTLNTEAQRLLNKIGIADLYNL